MGNCHQQTLDNETHYTLSLRSLRGALYIRLRCTAEQPIGEALSYSCPVPKSWDHLEGKFTTQRHLVCRGLSIVMCTTFWQSLITGVCGSLQPLRLFPVLAGWKSEHRLTQLLLRTSGTGHSLGVGDVCTDGFNWSDIFGCTSCGFQCRDWPWSCLCCRSRNAWVLLRSLWVILHTCPGGNDRLIVWIVTHSDGVQNFGETFRVVPWKGVSRWKESPGYSYYMHTLCIEYLSVTGCFDGQFVIPLTFWLASVMLYDTIGETMLNTVNYECDVMLYTPLALVTTS